MSLARLGYTVTILNPSSAMLTKAEQRLAAEPADVRRRVRLMRGAGEQAEEATGGERFAAVLCHGILIRRWRTSCETWPIPVRWVIASCLQP